MMKAALSMWGWTRPIPCSLADRADPAWTVRPVQASAVVADQDGTARRSPTPKSTVGAVRDTNGKRGGLIALADNAQHRVTWLDGEVLDVAAAGFADPQAVGAQQHSQAGVRVVVAFGGQG